MVAMLDELSNGRRTLVNGIENLRRWCQYQPWFIWISTLDRRLQLGLLLGPLAIIIIIIILCLTTGSNADGSVCRVESALYRGEYSSTQSGLPCQKWSLLNSSIHTVHPERYSQAGLGEHNFCRDPDGSGQLWCYTSLTMDHFDYCSMDHCGDVKPVNSSPDTRYLPGTDTSCIPEVSAVNLGPRVDGTYRMTDIWANGRGVYQRLTKGGGEDICISWHAQWRHWWFTLCSHAGINSGFSWMEEDGKCPYNGLTWRRGGDDTLKEGATVVPNHQYGENCIEYGTLYSGEPVGTGSRPTDNTAACRQYCRQTPSCRAFAYSDREERCRLFQSVQSKTLDQNYVSGSHTCQKKVKVGCPRGSERVRGGCFKFLDSAGRACADGCSRFRAMEECELSGGTLADGLPEEVIKDLLALSYSRYGQADWWLAAADFRKKSRFTWEYSDDPVSSLPELWHADMIQETNATNGSDSSTTAAPPPTQSADPKPRVDPSLPRGNTDGHSCVYIARFRGEMKLAQVNCDTAVARPLCQYLLQ